jgi:hypothetical protein
MENHNELMVELIQLHTDTRTGIVVRLEERTVELITWPHDDWMRSIAKKRARVVDDQRITLEWDHVPLWRIVFPLPPVRQLSPGVQWCPLWGRDTDALAAVWADDPDARVWILNGDVVVCANRLPAGGEGELEAVGDGWGIRIAPNVVVAVGGPVDET